MNIAIEYPALGYDGEFTFAGMLRKYFIDWDEFGNNIGVSKRWNDDTKATYIRHYEEKLIPMLADLWGSEKPLHSYNESELEEVFQGLKERYHYAEATVQHYRHLFWVVYRTGFEHGHYVDNLFWGGTFDLDSDDPIEREEIRTIIMTRTRRSLDVEEERKFIEWFCSLDPEEVSGEEIGLILMFFLGLRNNEACGANVDSVYLSKEAKSIPVFDMVQSTVVGSNKVKSGGKTRNAPRVIPMNWYLYAFIAKRKLFLERLVEGGKVILPDYIKSVDDMPLVCRGKSYLTRASTTDLSKMGREFFDKIGISKRTIAVLHQVLCSDEFKDLQLDEKEPTTYLLRRNFGTHLRLLGFSLDDIQYLIGHDIENLYLERNFFSDGEKLHEIWERLEKHPINIFLAAYQKQSVSEGVLQEGGKQSEENVYEFEFAGDSRLARIFEVQTEALEPGQSIEIEIVGDEKSNFDASIHVAEIPIDYLREVQVYGEQRKVYRRKVL